MAQAITVSCRYAYQNGFVDYRLKGSTTNNVIVPVEGMTVYAYNDPNDSTVKSVIVSRPSIGARQDFFVQQTVSQITTLVNA
jgi:hypothetical protein